MTLEQVKMALAAYQDKSQSLSKALEVNMRDGNHISEALKDLRSCVPVNMTNIAAAVTAIANGLAALAVCQLDQMKLMVDGMQRDKAVLDREIEGLKKAESGLSSGLIIPGGIR